MEISKTRTKKEERPGFEDFCNLVKETVGDKRRKDPVTILLRILKTGYKGGVGSHHMEGLFNLLVDWEHFWKLAVYLSFEEVKGKTRSPVTELVSRLKGIARELSEYPMNELYNTGQQLSSFARESILSRWIRKSQDSKDINQDWARQAFICILLMESDRCRLEAVHTLIKHFPVVRKQKEPATKSSDFLTVTEVNYFKILSDIFRKDLQKQNTKMNYILDILAPNCEQQNPLRSEVKELESKISDLTEDNLKMKRDLANVNYKLEITQEQINELQRQLEEKSQKLALEIEKSSNLDKYWKDKYSQGLAGQSYQIKASLLHEVNEATIALSMNPPDVDIALSMVKRMKECIVNIGG